MNTTKTLIVKTQEQAIEAAKNEAIADFSLSVSDTKESDWLIKANGTTQCACGETSAVRAVYFDVDGGQHFGFVGHCETCGVDY